MWLGAAALIDAAVVGINPTRRGAELARDITHADCQLIVTESRHVAPARRPRPRRLRRDRVLDVDSDEYTARARALRRRAAARRRDRRAAASTSCCSRRAPAAHRRPCICSQGRLAAHRRRSSPTRQPITPDDVMYQVMPLFHSNACMVGFGPWLAQRRAPRALRRRFSASGFLPDVRKYGVHVLQLRRQAALVHPRDTRAARRRRHHAARRVRQRGRRPRPRALREALRLPGAGRLRLHRGRRDHHRACPSMPKGALGRRRPRARVDPRSRDRRGVPAARSSTSRAGSLNPLEAIGEIVNKNGAAGVRGLLQERRGQPGARTRRLLLDRRPRLPRRRTATSTSPAATSSGCASTARTSRRRRSNASSRATPTSCSRRCTPCPTRRSATR